MPRVIKPKYIHNEKWKQMFDSKLVAPNALAYNAESSAMAALEEIKIFDLQAAKRDIKTVINYLHMIREALPPVGEKLGPKLVSKKGPK
jgi:hypothetical protein